MINRRIVITFAGLVAIVVVAIASPVMFSAFRAVPKNDDIELSWRTSNESGVQYFDIERRSDDLPEFRRLDRIAARGGASATYVYVDNGAFYKPTAGKRFSYRIRAGGSGGEQLSPIVTVEHEVSSVKRSWGMIKELFR
jgi:hypothetical protein